MFVWQVTLITISLVAALVSAWVSLIAQRRNTRGAAEIRLFAWLVSAWALLYAVALSVNNAALMMALERIKLALGPWLGLVWLALACRLTSKYRAINQRWFKPMVAIAGITTALTLLNPNELLWQMTVVDSALGFEAVALYPRALAALYLAATLGYGLIGLAVMVGWILRRDKGDTVSPLVWAFVIVTALSLLAWPLVHGWYRVDLFPVLGAFITYAMSVGRFQFRISDLLPVAYDSIIANMPNGVMIVDLQKRIRTINPALTRIANVQAQDVRGANLAATFPQLPTCDCEHECEIVWGERQYSLQVNAVEDGYGHVQGYLWVFHDITQRKDAEEELRRSLEKLYILRQITDEIADTLSVDDVLLISLDAAARLTGGSAGVIALLDADQRIISAQTVGQFSGLDALGALDMQAPAIGEVLESRRATLNTTTKRPQVVGPLVSRDRIIGIISLETARDDLFNQDTLNFIQVFGDRVAMAMENARLYRQAQDQIDELKRLYEQVSRLEGIKTDMIRIAAHDLRSPLSVLMGYLSMLEDDADQFDDELNDYVQQMLSATRRITVMIDEILSLDRIERMAQELTAEPFDMKPHAKEAVHEFRWLAQEKKINLSFVPRTDEVTIINGDPLQIYEAMINLISNGIKYTPEGGNVTAYLHTSQADNCVSFSVEDDGYGIPEDQQDDLFSAYTRASTAETSKVEGSGLGLNIVKKIIERHKGKLFFESKYRQGSTFGFSIPLYQPAPPPSAVDGEKALDGA